MSEVSLFTTNERNMRSLRLALFHPAEKLLFQHLCVLHPTSLDYLVYQRP